jgi:hypothetical protein
MGNLVNRLSRLEQRAGAKREPFRILLRVVNPDGSPDEILERGADGSWRPATETELAAAVAVLGDADWKL